ncbi:TANK-binding kinase 1-binding protein 1 isoform X3 [Physeter macrocephalus]|uniref:TANK-binding kinase 1-binding protein 1 isoform X3 n=1 Tax=Physeter macrocephalus TaxID=9755 RepID=A0A455C4J4_PHYMC|nr:TANK-binding kinase 1-binding protein 1 isoform X3 [Physeter catodon]|eukprot:XP_028354813.1 TANK-binding kinase 1-binding protein 1 isoform X3 [Physeter catodon]
MESMFEDDISILTQEALGPSEVWLDAPGDPSLGGDMCSASHFALITAYGDIKERLGGLERENATLRRRLKVYEIKLQKNKEQEEQLGEMIQAYEKLCVEKSDLETELGEMRALVETHLRQICGLEQQLRQQQGLRDAAFPSLSPPPAPAPPCADLDLHYLALRGGSGLSHGWPGPTPSMSELERRQLEEALEAAQGEARGAQLREEQLQAECERLQGELKQLQETRAQDLASSQSERDMAWVKRVGDDQVNLALAYTELTEELGRLRELSSLQGRILRTLLQEQARSGGQRHSPLLQRHSPAPQCPSHSPPARAAPHCPPCQSPVPQRRSPGPPCPSPQQRRSPASPSCPSPVPQRRSPVPPPCQSPSPQCRSPGPPTCPAPQPRPPPPPQPGERTLAERAYAKPPSHHVKAGFQGRRSYSEMAEGAGYAGASPPWLQAEAATLPKPRAYGSELYGPGRPLSPRRAFEGIRLRFEKQPSEEEEWAVPISPPSPEAGAIRCASFCAGFPIPESPAATAYTHAEHAQSWPSINLLMETVGSDIRSCPLCQLGFPVGYPDDALIKHIDSHLENSKI